MPNHCNNSLSVSGPKHIVQKFINFAQASTPWAANKYENDGTYEKETELLCCNQFIPSPKKEWDYDWCINNWGSKWGCYDISRYYGPQSVLYIFDTAWTPPEPVVEAMIKMFPKLRFIFTYEEEGVGFSGTLKGYRGKVYECKEKGG